MITRYVEDTSGWEDWLQEYRFGLLLIYPPERLRSTVSELRARYDPASQAICDAHITLTVPFPRALTAEDWEELRAIAAGIPPFEIRHGGLINYLPHPGVCLAIEPKDELARLLGALESASSFAGARQRSHPFDPHMTIAEFISVERTHELMDELKGVVPEGRFPCEAVSLAVPDEGAHFDERALLELG